MASTGSKTKPEKRIVVNEPKPKPVKPKKTKKK